MKIDSTIVHLSYGNFLYKKINNKIYWSNVKAPDTILKTKTYKDGIIEREDKINKIKTIIPSIIKPGKNNEFIIDNGKLQIRGKLSKNREITQLDNLELPQLNEFPALTLSPVSQKFLDKVVDFLQKQMK